LYSSLNGSSWGLANAVTVGALVVNTWYHVAIYRVGSSLYTAFNGTVTLVTASGAGTLVNNATNWYIGTETNGSTNPWTGWISSMRFVVGSSPYGATAFVPPTNSLAAITNTQFLALQSRIGENSHRFVDESGNKYIVFPNPNYDGKLHIKATKDMTNTYCEIFDARGVLVYGCKIYTEELGLMLPEKAGLYFVFLSQSGGNIKRFKVIRL
jgi:hypothetical protein